MVIKIQQGAASCRSPLDYNERKVASGEAGLVSIRNLEDSSVATIYRTFDSFENNPAISAKTGSMAFHMTVNPGPGEMLDPEQAAKLVDDIMDGLGYGRQPYVVYRHHDIDREHFHVVSVRVDDTGKVISNSFERRRLQQMMKELGPRYGFRTGRDVRKESNGTSRTIQRFDPTKGDISNQLLTIFKGCLEYSFTTAGQFTMLLEHFGVRIIQKSGAESDHIFLQGLDKEGAPCTRPVPQSDFQERLDDMMTKALQIGHDEHPQKRQERSRVGGIVRSCLGVSTSMLHFERMLAKKDITAVFSRTKDGRIFGATFIDHGTKCVFKCSELGEGLNASLFRKAEEDGEWKTISHETEPMETEMEIKHEKESHDDLGDIIEKSLTVQDKSKEKDMKKRRRKLHI